ncbi:MAG: hypothetical protein M1827_001481 [Pycnora praestabilis]|nr:MAG: hypothetical protein M1827_001481 [Pycnora praestabilis]
MTGIRTLTEWAGTRQQTLPFSVLKDAAIGIEAAHYLDRLLKNPPSKEPLLSALGGFPFALKTVIETELEALRAAGITPTFVFSGLEIAKKDKSATSLSGASRANTQAWELYDQHEAVQAVETFGNSGSVKAESLFRFLQKILREHNIDFMVAPYSAWAELAYLVNNPSQYVDAIVGSSELFLFEVDKVITKLDFETLQFSYLSRSLCLEDLGKISSDMFVDACLLSGSTFLPTFPPLEDPALYRKPFSVRDAVALMMNSGRSVTSVCTHYQDDARVQQLDYLDRYKRSRLAVKHHVVLTADGRVEPLDIEHAPSDVHEFIGQRFPEELFFYLSKGAIAPRILNWLASGEIVETPPLDGGDSREYQNLVRKQLTPIRTQALSLLAQSLTRYYQRKEITQRFWFDKDAEEIISLKDLPSSREIIGSWTVKQDVLETQHGKTGVPPGSIAFAVRSLDDNSLAVKTSMSKDKASLLTTKDEVMSNTLWRFLHLRGYINEKHTLTAWGKVLHSTIVSLYPDDKLCQSAFIAVELLRLGLLGADEMFPSYSGAPIRGSENDKRNCLLVSRVACLGKLQHKPIGFTGPLSRHLLAYHSIIAAVRDSSRDFVDISLATLLLNGNADRERKDWTDLGLDLPFLDDNDCGLGIAVKSYLDELAFQDEPTSDAAKDKIKTKGAQEWFPHSVDFAGDLAKAFRLWDAVYSGVKTAGKEVRGSSIWAEADEWLRERR